MAAAWGVVCAASSSVAATSNGAAPVAPATATAASSDTCCNCASSEVPNRALPASAAAAVAAADGEPSSSRPSTAAVSPAWPGDTVPCLGARAAAATTAACSRAQDAWSASAAARASLAARIDAATMDGRRLPSSCSMRAAAREDGDDVDDGRADAGMYRSGGATADNADSEVFPCSAAAVDAGDAAAVAAAAEDGLCRRREPPLPAPARPRIRALNEDATKRTTVRGSGGAAEAAPLAAAAASRLAARMDEPTAFRLGSAVAASADWRGDALTDGEGVNDAAASRAAAAVAASAYSSHTAAAARTAAGAGWAGPAGSTASDTPCAWTDGSAVGVGGQHGLRCARENACM